jgi:hypothetical protein
VNISYYVNIHQFWPDPGSALVWTPSSATGCLASEDIHAMQKMRQHSDPRTTNRYTLAAVDPRLKAAARLAQMMPPVK